MTDLEEAPEYYTHFSDRYLEAIEDRDTVLSFLFSFGDSTDGEVGACIRMVAYTPEAAIEKVKDMLWDFRNYRKHNIHDYDAEYFHIYFEPDNVGPEHIVYSETEIA